MAPQVLGVDPSLSATGLAWGDQATATCGGSGDQRLWVIYRSIRELAQGLDPLMHGVKFELAVVEALVEGGTGSARTGLAHGVTRLALMVTDVPYALVPPATLKKYATGKGNATKPDMRMALFQRTGLDLRDDNMVDAWWLRAMGLDYLGAPVVKLPGSHRAVMEKVVWPVLAGLS